MDFNQFIQAIRPGPGYVIAPKRTYKDESLAFLIKMLQDKFDVKLSHPKNLFRSNAEWLRKWSRPGFVSRFKWGLLFIGIYSTIGKGSYTELRYFLDNEIPVWKVYYTGLYRVVRVVDVRIIDEDDWINYAVVIYEEESPRSQTIEAPSATGHRPGGSREGGGPITAGIADEVQDRTEVHGIESGPSRRRA